MFVFIALCTLLLYSSLRYVIYCCCGLREIFYSFGLAGHVFYSFVHYERQETKRNEALFKFLSYRTNEKLIGKKNLHKNSWKYYKIRVKMTWWRNLQGPRGGAWNCAKAI